MSNLRYKTIKEVRNNTFLVLTILLIGGLFCLGIKKIGKNTSFPDRRGTMSPTSSVRFNSHPSRGERLVVSGHVGNTRQRTKLSAVNGQQVTVQQRSTIFKHIQLHSTTLNNIQPSSTTFNHVQPRSTASTIHTSSSTQLHSIGGGMNGSNAIITNSAKTYAATRNSGVARISIGTGSLPLPTYSNSSLLAYNNEIATNTTTTDSRAGVRATPRIGYSTNDSGNIRRRVYRPGIDEEDDGWYYDTDDNEWKEIPVGGEKMIDGILHVWNGSAWVRKDDVQDPSEVNYPLGNEAWILLLFAVAYAALVRKRNILKSFFKLFK